MVPIHFLEDDELKGVNHAKDKQIFVETNFHIQNSNRCEKCRILYAMDVGGLKALL